MTLKRYRIAPSRTFVGTFALHYLISDYLGWIMVGDAQPSIAAAMDAIAGYIPVRPVTNPQQDRAAAYRKELALIASIAEEYPDWYVDYRWGD